MAVGTNMGIFFMLGVTVAMLAAFACFFIYLIRRARAVEADSAPGDRGDRLMLNWLGMPVEASAHAGEIDQMIVLVHWLMLVLFVGWGAFFVFVLVPVPQEREPEGRATPAPKASSPRAPRSPSRSSKSCCWSSTRFRRGRSASRRSPSEQRSRHRPRRRRAVRVEHPVSGPRRQVRPHRHQAGRRPTTRSVSIARIPNAKDDITTINQLNLPVDRPVLVHLSSKDVIHSFGLYEMRVKQDAIPGPRDSGVVHPTSRPTTCAAAEKPTSTTRSPARSSAASATTACAASSPSRAQADYEQWMADQVKALASQVENCTTCDRPHDRRARGRRAAAPRRRGLSVASRHDDAREARVGERARRSSPPRADPRAARPRRHVRRGPHRAGLAGRRTPASCSPQRRLRLDVRPRHHRRHDDRARTRPADAGRRRHDDRLRHAGRDNPCAGARGGATAR